MNPGDIEQDQAKRFDGHDEVYLDIGILYYKKNNYRLAIDTLDQFLVKHMPRDDKRAEGLYYKGKSHLQLGQSEKAVKNYMELLESMPDSIYASAARSELEEIEWRKSLNSQ
ncbi:tetratricopeptide repeat protein [Limisalsivibrio acetivorans]|uniref:tetratricopeptide repeat protein n=1 Tax=Limisalsivibrio acetivorans TaxID=1304888 RepID=UPI0003B65F25|nr:tetratricopeptide repeat protein [Limisalsivibrio acetivorans]